MDVSKTVAEQPGQASIIYGKQDITLFSYVKNDLGEYIRVSKLYES
jgi:hypothetical protein